MTIVAERGRPVPVPVAWLCGQLLVMLLGPPFSPGCWMLTNSVRPSGVESMPVISHCFGPTRKRFSDVPGALPMRVDWLAVTPFRLLVIVRVPPSPTVPGIAASIMQLVTSV